MGKSIRWSEQEDEILRSKYENTSTKDMRILLPQRSENAIDARARMYKLKQPSTLWPKAFQGQGRWNTEEDQVIRDIYPEKGTSGVQSILPHRNTHGIVERARVLGITKIINYVPTCAPANGPIIAHLTDQERGYLAGIIDGEGCIFFGRTKSSKSNYFIYTLQLSISSTSILLLDWLTSHVGGRVYRQHAANGKRRASFQWNFPRTERVTQLLSEISPYLIEKREQAELMVKGYKHLSYEDRAILWQKMRDLKKS